MHLFNHTSNFVSEWNLYIVVSLRRNFQCSEYYETNFTCEGSYMLNIDGKSITNCFINNMP